MAVLHPFRALRPIPEKASRIACVPYDVINTAEARALAEGNADSFLHVIRPEIDLPEGVDVHADIVYQTGAANLKRLAAGPDFLTEPTPSVYLYRQIMDGRAQTGLFACVSVDDYDNDVILKHEKTRPDKEDDRTRHIVTQRAHAEPVMLTFKDRADISALISACSETEPLYDLTASDGVQHTIWRFQDAAAVVKAFESVEHLYVADGHHRCKAASRAAAELGSAGEARFFPAVLIPMGGMAILPYNRIIRKLPESPAAFRARLDAEFGLQAGAGAVPEGKGSVSVYLDGAWYGLKLPKTTRSSVADRLDVGRLTEFVLEPLLGITDPRTDSNIDFVGGIRGTAELERLVDGGHAELAISMYATGIDELVAVSDAGLLMPPKSTWFEPKLRSGLLIHLID